MFSSPFLFLFTTSFFLSLPGLCCSSSLIQPRALTSSHPSPKVIFHCSLLLCLLSQLPSLCVLIKPYHFLFPLTSRSVLLLLPHPTQGADI
jgi:hypothetical protein